MIINQSLLDSLSAQAAASPRLRAAFDLRTTPSDGSQRMLNAVEPGTMVPIHRHTKTSETITILRGKAEQFIYDDGGAVILQIILAPDSDTIGLNIPKGTWHKIVSLEHGTVICEAKDGPYEALSSQDILQQ